MCTAILECPHAQFGEGMAPLLSTCSTNREIVENTWVADDTARALWFLPKTNSSVAQARYSFLTACMLKAPCVRTAPGEWAASIPMASPPRRRDPLTILPLRYFGASKQSICSRCSAPKPATWVWVTSVLSPPCHRKVFFLARTATYHCFVALLWSHA